MCVENTCYLCAFVAKPEFYQQILLKKTYILKFYGSPSSGI